MKFNEFSLVTSITRLKFMCPKLNFNIAQASHSALDHARGARMVHKRTAKRRTKDSKKKEENRDTFLCDSFRVKDRSQIRDRRALIHD